MALAHAQLFSMSQLRQLTERAKLHAQHQGKAAPENLDEFFEEDDDDLMFEVDR